MLKIPRRHFLWSLSALITSSRSLRAQSDPAIRRAMESMLAAIPAASNDRDRPVYHFRPPANWHNDPNGTIYYKGWHHLFYQLNPFGSGGGNQHWGHARSRDLVNWQHLPVAIAPSPDKSERAIFSGGATLGPDGRPRLFYTSIGHPSPEQWMASPLDDDLISWVKHPGNPVLSMTAHGQRPISNWRDPFLFKEDGQTYMVCGGALGTQPVGGGEVQLYRAGNSNLTQWIHLGPVFQYRDREIWNVECPNLFKLDGKWVLIISPQQPCEYFVGDLDLKRVRFTPDTHGILDAGTAYASNISTDDKSRTILWLWGRTNTPPGRGWNNVMTLPRILSIDSAGFLRQRPAPEFEALRGTPLRHDGSALAESVILEGLAGDCLELDAELVLGNAAAIGLEVRRSAAGKAGATISIDRTGRLSIGTANTLVGRAERYRLRVFLDKRALEVYVNDGEVALFVPVDAPPEDVAIAAFAQRGFGRQGGPPAPSTARLNSVTVWPMQSAEFDLTRFRA